MPLIVALEGKVERVRSNKSRDGKQEDNRTVDLTTLIFLARYKHTENEKRLTEGLRGKKGL